MKTRSSAKLRPGNTSATQSRPLSIGAFPSLMHARNWNDSIHHFQRDGVVVTLRIFEDTKGKMNHDVQDIQGAVLVVSQFTLYADSHKGRRPSFTRAARPALAQQLYETFLAAVARYGVPVAHGAFGAHMAVSLVNDGPVTLWLESPLAAE